MTEVTWFRCPECEHVWGEDQPDPDRAWCCGCGTSNSYPELHVMDGCESDDPECQSKVKTTSVSPPIIRLTSTGLTRSKSI